MPIRLPYSFLKSLTTTAPDRPMLELVDAGRRAYCNLYNNHPTWTFVKNNITLPIVKRTLDDICADIGSPPSPPVPDFTGGQCAGVAYNVEVEFSVLVSGGARQPGNITIGVVNGAIVSVLVEDHPSDVSLVQIVAYADPAANLGVSRHVFGNYSKVNADPIIEDIRIGRVDGQPDDCGDPQPQYPIEPPPTVPDVTQDINITNIDGDSFTYNTVVNFDGDNTIVFPPTILVNNEVEITIDIDGVSIENPKNKPSGNGGGSPEPVEEEEEPETEEIEKLVAITIVATGDEADIVPSTSGRGTSPNVHYIGWVQFNYEGFNYPRQFIHFERSRFQAPEDVEGYTVRFNPAWSGVVEEIRKTVEVPVETPSESGNNGATT